MKVDSKIRLSRSHPIERTRRADDIILDYYDACLRRHKDTAKGAGWPNEADRRTRFDVMLDILSQGNVSRVTLCDVGCGTGELLSFIKEKKRTDITYIGVDRSSRALEFARLKHPDGDFFQIDILDPESVLDGLLADYVIANGLFTVKAQLSQDDMRAFWEEMVAKMWSFARRGIAFNLMSKIVDWERDDLFHMSMDEVAGFVAGFAGRNIAIRADYGLYEYTVYVRKQPELPTSNSLISIAAPSATTSISVLDPSLPTKAALSPYLDRIDKNHIYSNHGPLSLELAARLSEQFYLEPATLVCASSGTTALTSAILVAAGRANTSRPLALVPSFTFPATALAAEQCGYEVVLADIDETTWMLDADAVKSRADVDRIGVVIPVAPFGRAVPQAPWLEFRRQTEIPVVIDAAACFEAYSSPQNERPGLLPSALSFHATKTFSTGEGGAIVSQYPQEVLRAAQSICFGFRGERVCSIPSLNGKMSEYHAAVGLADLDNWKDKAKSFAATVEIYREEFCKLGLSKILVSAPDIASCYMLIQCMNNCDTERLRAALNSAGVGHRAWYASGLHLQPHFYRAHYSGFPVTESVSGRLIGLPAGTRLSRDQIRAVATLVEGHFRA